MPDGLQYSQHPAHRPVTPTYEHSKPGNLPERMEAGKEEEMFHSGSSVGTGATTGGRSSPGQRTSGGDVEHLVGVQKFPEAVEKLSAFQTAALRVDKHQQGTDVLPQLVVLRDIEN